ncbi:MAG: CHASE2 domain-containing protein [Armatimonadetes bacterium]|nr:CHASE2 domain-containing protein [Armatimonadota bacterium]
MGLRWIGWTVACSVAACLLAAHGQLVDARLTDFLCLLRGPRPAQAPIVVVALRAQRSSDIGPWGTSPAELAVLLRQISRGNPSAIGIAITPLTMMPEGRPGIEELAAAIRECKRLVLPAAAVPASEGLTTAPSATRFSFGEGELLRPAALKQAMLATPPEMLVAAAAGLGTTNLYPDVDGVVRTFPLIVSAGGRLYPSMPLELARVAMGLAPGALKLERSSVRIGEKRIPVLGYSAEMLIDFPQDRWDEWTLTAQDVMSAGPGVLAQRFRGKIVLICSSAPGLAAVFPIPGGPAARGADIVAAATENIVAGRWMRQVSPAIAWLAGLAVAMAAMWLSWRLPPLLALAADAALLAATLAGLGFAASLGYRVSGLCILVAGALSSVVNVAGQASAAVRERIAAEVRAQSRMQALERIGELLGSALNRDELLHAIMRWVTTELQSEAASLLLLDESEKVLRFQIALGPKGPEVKDFVVPLGHGIAGYVAQTGEPLIVEEGWRDPRHARDISSAVGFQPRNILCVPMRLHGKVIGVIEVMNKAGNARFDLQDEYLLAAIAQQAALLLENARLYSELQRRVDYANAELREAYRQLASEKAKVETLIDQMASPVVATDADNAIVLLNDAAEQVLGVRASEVIGKHVYAAIPVPEVAVLFAADLGREGGQLVEEIELSNGGISVYRASIALVKDSSGNVMGKSLVMIDITELRQLDRMKTDLISFVAHELRNPLSVMSGFAELCLRRLGQGSHHAAEEMLRRIEATARRTARLVEDFLNIARLEAGRPLDFDFEAVSDVADIVREVIELEPRKKPTHRFVVDISENLPPIYVDRAKFEEVLTNVVGNAVKYSPAGGEIRIAAQPEGALMHFTVSDQGLGIPPHELPHIFEKFRRVRSEERKAVPGTGIGLYLCKQIIEGHGGQIWVESEPGRGTTVHFTVPLAASVGLETSQDDEGRNDQTGA